MRHAPAPMRGGRLLLYLGVFSSGATFWLMQRALAVLSPGAVTAYSYLVPFTSVAVAWVTRPQQVGWRWLPGALLVALAMGLLLAREAGPRAARPPAALRRA